MPDDKKPQQPPTPSLEDRVAALEEAVALLKKQASGHNPGGE